MFALACAGSEKMAWPLPGSIMIENAARRDVGDHAREDNRRKARIEKSSRMTSSVKRTPPIGESKMALMPAAHPQPISTGICCRLI